MIRETLQIRTDKGLGASDPTFKGIELTAYSAKFPRMGFPELTATLMWPSALDDEWTHQEYVTLRGERFYIRHTPTGKIGDGTHGLYKHELEFTSEFAEVLGNTYFEDAVPSYAATYDKPCSNNAKFSFYGTIAEFLDRLNCSFLKAGIGDSVLNSKTSLTTQDTPVADGFCAVLDPAGEGVAYDPEKTYNFEWEDKTHWEAITEGFTVTEIPFERRGRSVIFGAVPKVVDHKFEQGHDNELLSVSHKNAKAKVINRITMLGSTENIPYYYPNETEYGHIVLMADAGNSVLSVADLTMKRPDRMVSLINADQQAVLCEQKELQAQVGYGFMKYRRASSEGWQDYSGADIGFDTSGIAKQFLYIQYQFSVFEKGEVSIEGILGQIWIPNQSPQGDDSDLLSSKKVKISYFGRLDGASVPYEVNGADGSIRFGVLPRDEDGESAVYVLEFTVDVPVRAEVNGPMAYIRVGDIRFRLPHVAHKFYWKVGDKTYDRIEALGLSLSKDITSEMVGDKFGWESKGRMPFQDRLIPPKYRETMGAERFYNAVNSPAPNLALGTEEPWQAPDYVFANGSNYTATAYDSYGLKTGDTLTVSFDYEASGLVFAEGSFINLQFGPNYKWPSAQFNLRQNGTGRHVKTLQITAEDVTEDTNGAPYFRFDFIGKTDGGYFKAWNFKVEKGANPNPQWSPALSEQKDNPYIDPDTGRPYAFPNPFIEGAPCEHIFKDESIKPTIEGVENADGELFGEIAAIAYDADDSDALKPDSGSDSKNDALKYEHSFFYIKLNTFSGDYGFDLFAHASQSDAMTIQMRDGSCNGCKFKIQAAKFEDASGFYVFKNPVIVKDGVATGVISEENVNEADLDPTQQNTQTNSIWVCVQKDASTFGKILPNKENNYKPKVGDKFNLTNIVMPTMYWLAAEKRLEQEGMRYMADNNEEQFAFDISASRIFFAENPDVLAQLDEYSKIKVTYDGKEYERYVNQLSIDCKDNEALPDIGIDLADELSASQSFAERVAERAASLIANPYTMGGALPYGSTGSGGGLDPRIADQRYLKKIESDRSKGRVASDVGFEVGEFMGGASGGIFYVDPETGQTYIEADKLRVRMKAIFAELEVAKEQSIGGKFDITPGGGIDISFVEELTDSYRCYFKAKDEDKGADCRFVVGDQARCHESNISAGTAQDASNRYYWRLVTAVNNDEGYIELSKTDRDHGEDFDSAAPMAGDTIVQFGNRNNPQRQSAIVLSTVDEYAPSVTLYSGIVSYSLAGKEVVEYGVDKSVIPPRPFFNCFGNAYVGNRTKSSFMQYTPENGLVVRGAISSLSTIVGEDGEEVPFGEYVEGQSPYLFDMDNEMAAVACDASGLVIGPLPSTGLRVYKGGELDTEWAFSIPSGGNVGCAGYITGNTLQVHSLYADTATLTVQATKAGAPALTATMNIYKVKPGQNGADGSSYAPNIIEGTSHEWDSITVSAWYALVKRIAIADTDVGDGERITFSVDLKTETGKKLSPRIQFYNSESDRISVTASDYVQNGEGRLSVSATLDRSYEYIDLLIDANKTADTITNATTEQYRKAYLCKGESTEWVPSAEEMLAPVVYSMELSANNITRDALGALSASSITVQKYKTTGTKARELTAEKSIRYIREGYDSDWTAMSADASSYAIPVPSSKSLTAIVIELMDGITTLDRERVPVIDDGTAITENLAKNSEVNITTTVMAMHTFTLSEPLVVGAAYTFTVWGTPPTGGAFLVYDTNGVAMMGNRSLASIANGVYSLTATIPSIMANLDRTRLLVVCTHGEGAMATLKRFKVEKGENAAPVWTQSPHDMDYITAALKEDGKMEGGLILGSLMRLGYTASSGEYKVTAGLNGIADSTDAPALFAGGEMLDKAAYPNSANAAKAMIRHNGTAYFCNNTVRLLDNLLQIGQILQLDESGLAMLIGDNTALNVGNVAVSASQASVSASLAGVQCSTYNFFYVDGAGEIYPTGAGAEVQLYNGVSVPAGTILTGSGTLATNNVMNISTTNAIGTLYVDVLLNGIMMQSYPYNMEYDEEMGQWGASFNLWSIRLPATGIVSIRVRWAQEPREGHSEFPGNPNGTAKLTFTEGSLRYSAGNKTTLGNNGILAVWGQSTFICADDGVTMQSGNHGLRVTPQGIQKLVNGQWQTANI